jgi:hypothetical protein
VISLVRPSAAISDLREVLRDLLNDPQATVLFRQYLSGFLTSYVALGAATLDFGVNSAEINRIVACLKALPFDDWRTPSACVARTATKRKFINPILQSP